MNILIDERKEETRVSITGRLNADTAAEFDKKSQIEIVTLKKDVKLDCENLDYISSAGLSCLIVLSKNLKSCECTLTLLNVKPMVNDILRITGLIGNLLSVKY